MAVSFTAFLAGIDAEIRTVIIAMTAERSSAAGLIASVRFTPLVLFKYGSMILPTKCSVISNSNKTGQNADWNADHTQTQCLKTDGMTNLFFGRSDRF